MRTSTFTTYLGAVFIGQISMDMTTGFCFGGAVGLLLVFCGLGVSSWLKNRRLVDHENGSD